MHDHAQTRKIQRGKKTIPIHSIILQFAKHLTLKVRTFYHSIIKQQSMDYGCAATRFGKSTIDNRARFSKQHDGVCEEKKKAKLRIWKRITVEVTKLISRPLDLVVTIRILKRLLRRQR
jgi:translation initiation factor 2 alpha subunit (eIF-2alpha)